MVASGGSSYYWASLGVGRVLPCCPLPSFSIISRERELRELKAEKRTQNHGEQIEHIIKQRQRHVLDKRAARSVSFLTFPASALSSPVM